MRWLLPCSFFLLLALGAGWVLSVSEEARDVSMHAARALFGFVTTPFIMESSIALGGVLFVLTYNEFRRRKDEADEWVVLPLEDSTADEEPSAENPL